MCVSYTLMCVIQTCVYPAHRSVYVCEKSESSCSVLIYMQFIIISVSVCVCRELIYLPVLLGQEFEVEWVKYTGVYLMWSQLQFFVYHCAPVCVYLS